MGTLSEENRNKNLNQIKKKIPSQNNMVLIALFLIGTGDAETVWKKCREKYHIKSPLTSIRRSITNLKNLTNPLIAETERTVHTDNQGVATVYKVSYLGEIKAKELLGNQANIQTDLFTDG